MKKEIQQNTSWAALPERQKLSIEKSLQQLKAGKGISLKKAMTMLAKKYNIPKN